MGRLIGLRHTPSLEFIADALPEDAQRIDDLVAATRERTRSGPARPGRQPGRDPDPYKKPADDWSGDDDDDDWDIAVDDDDEDE